MLKTSENLSIPLRQKLFSSCLQILEQPPSNQSSAYGAGGMVFAGGVVVGPVVVVVVVGAFVGICGAALSFSPALRSSRRNSTLA